MVAEILEIVRAERSNPARTAPPDASTLDHCLRAIRDLLLDQSKFLSSCLNPLAGFRFEDGDVYFIYPWDAGWAVDLMKARERQEKLASVCKQVLGQPVRIHFKLLKKGEPFSYLWPE